MYVLSFFILCFAVSVVLALLYHDRTIDIIKQFLFMFITLGAGLFILGLIIYWICLKV